VRLYTACHAVLSERRRTVALTAEAVDSIVDDVSDLAMVHFEPEERRKLLESLCGNLGVPWYVNAYDCEPAQGTQSMTPIASIAVYNEVLQADAMEDLDSDHRAKYGERLTIIAEFRPALQLPQPRPRMR
jgi:hypothetical protein